MPNIIEITDFHAPELDPYARLTQNQLRSRLEPEKGIFIAESPKVISRALDAGFVPVSLLMERRQITGPAAEILTRCGDAPIYTADRELLAALTGYELTRGVLCAFQRPKPRTVEEDVYKRQGRNSADYRVSWMPLRVTVSGSDSSSFALARVCLGRASSWTTLPHSSSGMAKKAASRASGSSTSPVTCRNSI